MKNHSQPHLPTGQVEIDTFRRLAEQTGQYAGQAGPLWCGPEGVWRDVWLEARPPVAARVGVYRHDFREPLWRVARLERGPAERGPGERGGGEAAGWPVVAASVEHRLARRAEARALRAAFPQALEGFFLAEEARYPAVPPATVRRTVPALRAACAALLKSLGVPPETARRPRPYFAAALGRELPRLADLSLTGWDEIHAALAAGVRARARAFAAWGERCRREGWDRQDRSLRLRVWSELLQEPLPTSGLLSPARWRQLADLLGG